MQKLKLEIKIEVLFPKKSKVELRKKIMAVSDILELQI